MFRIPLPAKLDHGSIKSTVCRSSCPELSECVSYALQMIDIALNAERVCVATYWLGKESVLSSPAFHHEL